LTPERYRNSGRCLTQGHFNQLGGASPGAKRQKYGRVRGPGAPRGPSATWRRLARALNKYRCGSTWPRYKQKQGVGGVAPHRALSQHKAAQGEPQGERTSGKARASRRRRRCLTTLCRRSVSPPKKAQVEVSSRLSVRLKEKERARDPEKELQRPGPLAAGAPPATHLDQQRLGRRGREFPKVGRCAGNRQGTGTRTRTKVTRTRQTWPRAKRPDS